MMGSAEFGRVERHCPLCNAPITLGLAVVVNEVRHADTGEADEMLTVQVVARHRHASQLFGQVMLVVADP